MRLLISFLMVFLLIGCKSTPSYLNTQQLKNQYQTIGFASFSVENSLDEHREHLVNNLQEPITSALVQEGFKIVDATKLFDNYSKLLENTDNLYDPLTGQENENLRSEVWKQALKQTKLELGVDAFMFIGVDIVRAYFDHNIFSGKVARWWGQEESYLAESAGTGATVLSFMLGKQGYVPGSRVYIRIRDEADKLLTFGSGGIELVGQFNGDGEIEVKPAEVIFQDKTKLQQAAQYSLQTMKDHKGGK